ncbi:hypothetical protein [Pseudomonas monteilii]|nr:hypothetical protein [Pseudomonas monteilii]
MARKQETPASTADAKGPSSTPESSGVQPEGAGLPTATDAALLPGSGGVAPLVADPVLAIDAPVQKEGPSGAEVVSTAVAGEVLTDPAASTVVTGEPAVTPQTGSSEANAGDDFNKPAVEEQSPANPNPVSLQVYPMRSYMDEGELRRRGGPAYSVPRRHAEELVDRKLASLEPLKE